MMANQWMGGSKLTYTHKTRVPTKKKTLQERKIKLNTSLQFSTLTNPPTKIRTWLTKKQFNVYDNTPQKRNKK